VIGKHYFTSRKFSYQSPPL